MMPTRAYIRTILASSVISVFLVVGLLRFGLPPSSQATTPTQPEMAFGDDELINIRLYASQSRGVANITSISLEYTWFFEAVPRQGVGSGVVLDDQGHLITNYHVVRGAERLDVTLHDKSRYQAQLLGSDPVNDIAILKIDCPKDKLHPISLAGSEEMKVGQKVLAIGNPFGLEGTLTTGIISSLGRTLRTDYGIIDEVIQTDAAINPGNSGGPLLNRKGELIGINTAIFSTTGESAGIGFAVPVGTLRRILPDLLQHGRVLRPWFGIGGRELTPRLADALDLPADSGVLIEQVETASSADLAGLQGGRRRVRLGNLVLSMGGDIITSMGGEAVTSMDTIQRILQDKRPGDEISIEFYRGQQRRDKTIELVGRGERRGLRF